ncbi:receptor tyrosine-protein kinase erbB-3-like isoform X2 [Astyanax mexicanus]|uniref:receptor protein-tyrosine kinase n=1 Tax=Astyanax mexicanus TaxID=7994 RepID=A0A8T2LE39_ASTMX|nr:receptor tyrosine-protein kinase erbB-3-like isoform X2 [Astyanax mexicanus]
MRAHVLLLLVLFRCLEPAAPQTRKDSTQEPEVKENKVKPQEVCLGTTNGLSFTDSSALHYKNLKARYENCEIIIGNLEITLMERHFDFSFLGGIREVTGYVLIATNQFSRLPLGQLRVIRGSTLYDQNWALSVFLNFDGQTGLEEMGLTHLTEILAGGVQIVNNKFLSYVPSINWKDIVSDSSARVEIDRNGPELACHPDCRGHCWGPNKDQCQTLTKTVCAPQCHGRCFGTSPRDCCNTECAGGCTGPLETHCFACRHVNHSGACVPHCPQPLIYNRQTFQLEPNPDAMYQYGSVCMPNCPDHFVVDGSACVSSCPLDKMEVERNGTKRCEPCVGLCPKVCNGTGASDRQTVDSSNIDTFINCTKIQGSLHFLVTGIHGDDYNKIPPLDPKKLKYFSTVREITGVLDIQSWPKELSDLSYFSNLTTIRGRSLRSPFSLLLMKVDSLTSLGLRSLREINDGSVYISNNTNLCYHHTVDWGKIFTGNRRQRRLNYNDIKFNKPQSQCEEAGRVCDPLCSDAGCWGPGPEQCLFCRNHSRDGTCVAQCNIYSGETREFTGPNGECLACHPECLQQEGEPTCRGKGADECVACSNLMDGPHCVSSCPNGVNGERGQAIFKYHNSKRQCEPCHPNCTRGCTGPTLRDCINPDRASDSPPIAAIVSGVLAGLIVCLAVAVLSLLYHRGLAIRHKRALRRYLESRESIEPLDPGEKGTKVHARILRASELRKGKLLGSGVFGTVHKSFWIPEGDSLKIPVAIKTIQDRSGRQTFTEITDHMLSMGSLDHPYIVRLLGICPGPSLQLVTQLSTQGSLLQHLRQNANSLDPQRLLNWCVQIAKGMYYLEEHCMVHRNLAARNVLLKSDYMVQISDFGVADLLYPDDKKYVYSEHKTPIKWMALESILFRRYSHQSDVWSYGVTVWEMMSHGAEPYATMHPHDVPNLLEKGERLAQPQICTIDVYMVMVKCWMIDENIRPTFKELANEFTRMARDPQRYLVVKNDRNSAVSDESHSREFKLTEVNLESEDEEVLDDGFATPPLHLSPSRSHSRLRIGSYRSGSGQSVPVGYLPMTPSPGEDSRQLWYQRKRLGSARTTSESSEGRGTVVDIEMGEIVSQTGSLRRGHSRADSAYMSNCVSVASDPLSPVLQVAEEDTDGYVLPRSAHNSERDALMARPGSRASLPRSRSSRNTRSQLSPLSPSQEPPQEYELMTKQQPTVVPHLPKDRIHTSTSIPGKEGAGTDPLACSTNLPPYEDAIETAKQQPAQYDTCKGEDYLDLAASEDTSAIVHSPEAREDTIERDHQPDEEISEGNNEDGATAEERPPQQAVVEYEYMDIQTEPKPVQSSSEEERTERCSDETDTNSISPCKVKRESTEDVVYQNMCDIPALKSNSTKGSSFKANEHSSIITCLPEEYEDMGVVCGRGNASADQVEYQNMPAKDRKLQGEVPHSAKLRAFRGACSGPDEKNGKTSFDNPDYWHSRLFHKPDAVCT